MNPHPRLLLLFAFTASIGFAAEGAANQSWQEKDGNDVVYFNVEPERSAPEAAKARAEIPPVSFTAPANRWSKLPISRELLARTNSTWRVVMLGDSIVNDTWRSRFADDVQARWPGTKLDLTAVVGGGKGCWWYAQSNRVARHVVPLQPDLLIIGGISQRGDVEAIRKVIREVRAGKHCDVLLLTGPFGSVDPLNDATWSKERNGTNTWHARLAALAQNENAAFFDLQFAWGDYIRGSGKPLAWFKRDEVHANARGEAVLGYLMSATLAPAVSDARIVFPRDASVLDAKRDFGAKGDGTTDDTAALQAAIEASSGTTQRMTRVLFIPNGTYRVTDALVVKKRVGPWVYGESRDGVVIRLVNGVGTNVTSVLRTHPQESGNTSADWFMRNFRNLTIDVGNNPEVDGIRFYGNNSSSIQNVRVTGRGKVGINAGFFGQNGPNLIQDCEIDGFETGVRSAWSWGGTISRVTIRNCRSEGLYVSATALGVEDLVVENTPCAVRNDFPNDWRHWGGVVALVGGRFTTKNSDQPAIDNRSVLFARDVKTSGFKSALRNAKKDSTNEFAGPNITEFTSSAVKHLFDGPTNSLRLAIKREPEFAWETDTNKWVCANNFGAKYGDNKDDTAAIQQAIDAAAAAKKTVVYLRGIGGGDSNWYNINAPIHVHGSVRHVIALGFGRVIAGTNGAFVVDDLSAPVVKFQNLQAFGGKHVTVENRSATSTLIVEGCDMKIRGTGRGDIFATDCPSHVELRSPGQKMWARQLNPEGTSDIGLVRNSGADLWVLGVKFEGAGVRIQTSDGGRTEAFGMFNYGPGNIKKDDTRPMFDTDNASFSMAGAREITFGAAYNVKARERRGEETRVLDSSTEGGWTGWALYRGGKQ